MRVSLAWIKRLLGAPLGMTADQLLVRIGLSVTEIERAERTGPGLAGVVVGRVLTCSTHPNAERLRLTTVDIGSGQVLRIVCGAPNVAAGQMVAVATIGTTLALRSADGQVSSVTIRAAKLRGEPSEGMLCAEDELGLGSGHDGILVLDPGLIAGTALCEALGLGDTVWVVENHAITHRPDLWGQLGWAREVAASTATATPGTPDIGWNDRGSGWSLAIQDPGCTTYCAAVVEMVKNPTSPRWLQDLLEACGVRPLGLLVDITNFVMLELGAPMHAFDLRCLRGRSVGVRSAQARERFTTLDGVERELCEGDLLIQDGEGPIALAGIMGGAGTMIRDDTSAVLLEAAIFRPERIRRTRQRTGLATDSSARFEKGLYAELAPAAINRALALLEELCPGCRVTHRLHQGPLEGDVRDILFHPSQVERLTGLAVEPAAQRAILERLGFRVSGDQVRVPWWRRKDVHGHADLVEEVARHHGYDRIAPAIPRLPAIAPPPHPLRRAEHRARQALSAQGWDEVATYSFTSQAWIEVLGEPAAAMIRLEHPLSSEQTVLRPTLIPGLAEAIGRNRKQLASVSLYEVGKRYARAIGLRSRLSPPPATGEEDEELVVAGMHAAASEEAPFYAARDALLALVRDLGYGEAVSLHPSAHPHRGLGTSRCLDLMIGRGPQAVAIGVVGEVLPCVRQTALCSERVGYFCLHLEELVARLGSPRPVRYRPPSRYQKVEREFTWVCAETVSYQQLADVSATAAGALLAGLDLVTVYRGEPIPGGQKAVSLRVGLQAQERTLEEKELGEVTARIVHAVTSTTGAQLRA